MNVVDISIPLRFDGQQPNAFGVARATATPLGDTRTGSSVNFERYTFTPHCNGTHTECVGHITDARISVRDCLKDVIVQSLLISIQPETGENGDRVISRRSLENVVVGAELRDRALVVRTLPNDETKLGRVYDETNVPPYFAPDAVDLIVECGVRHLLVDLPSIDRLSDDGKLVNHRTFWNVEPGSREVNVRTRTESTITEMIYVPNEVEDGNFLLNIQIPPFESDAAPSRPLLFDRMFESSL